MPKQAIPLFEQALTTANENAKNLLGATIGSDTRAFLRSQHVRIRNDAQLMYEALHRGEIIPDGAVAHILDELGTRLGKTRRDKLILRVAHSPVEFSPAKASEWSAPWSQPFALLKGIAEFPRRAMTDPRFWQSIWTNEDDLIRAMDVAGDKLIQEYGGREARQRAQRELDAIKQLEHAPGDVKDKCCVLWDLMMTGDTDSLERDIVRRHSVWSRDEVL